MRIAVVLAAALCCAPLIAAPVERDWQGYGNARFNFAACYPPGFRGLGEATNGDGQRFRARDGAELAVFGSNVEPGAPIDDYLQDSIAEIAGKSARITYRARKANWLVTSGVGPKGEFYVKRYLRKDQMLSFHLTYPAAQHARYAPLVAAMVRCFTIGSEPGY